jgi:RNA polymerase sigma-70 factor (ECF subfamily)
MTTHRKERQAEQAVAFERIVSHYEARLIRYAARVTGSGDVAQDVVQDTFIRLFRHWNGDLEPSPGLSGWLYRVAHNRAVDAVRRRSRQADVETRHAAEQPESEPPAVDSDMTTALRARSALRSLSPREQQLVILKVYEEKSYREISEITGLTSGNVGYILHHAMRKMAQLLKKGGGQ